MSMSQSNDLSGWAVRRNGSCAADEVDCGLTAAPFHTCCAEGAFCPASNVSNNYCCNSNSNCTQTILEHGPYCANFSFTLYDNSGNFCCGAGQEGFRKDDGTLSSYGCASLGYELEDDEHYLAVEAAKSKRECFPRSRVARIKRGNLESAVDL